MAEEAYLKNSDVDKVGSPNDHELPIDEFKNDTKKNDKKLDDEHGGDADESGAEVIDLPEEPAAKAASDSQKNGPQKATPQKEPGKKGKAVKKPAKPAEKPADKPSKSEDKAEKGGQ